ncbi:hypothetical protein SAMN06265365_115123 [Tistlia consotensis]|uniref:PPC domain-containing protein n=1 Tax=Tistlia consotensis USBA 355 TaxID=560819 RepID=A0A1Y6CAH0_9PROT|nr:hypothetical protein [Tistlia consotensis]SMF45488.1 hypothetical protein SAMN05428998_11610 [Tistlia consotensis USBA 355]SNR79816.1 hypothetical protein SAMN06265365_115123 [Tistlia consotensis]
MRLIKHPGRPTQPRRQIAVGRSAGEWRVTLAPGSELAAALLEGLAARGVEQAAVQLLSGGLERLELRRGGPLGEAPPKALEGPLTLIGGSGLVGRDAAGGPLFDCRIVALDAAGRLRGGRPVAGSVRAGAEGLVAMVAGLAGAGFVEGHDEETGETLLIPRTQTARGEA